MMNNLNQQFIDAIEDGLDAEKAATLCGLPPMAMLALLERGKREQYRIFASGKNLKPKASEAGALALWVEYAAARSRGIHQNIKVVKAAAIDGDWKAARYLLEKTHPEAYGTNGSVTELEAPSFKELGQL